MPLFYSTCNEMAHLPGHRPETKTKKRLFPVKWSLVCTPGMGVNLWGESPLYENRRCS